MARSYRSITGRLRRWTVAACVLAVVPPAAATTIAGTVTAGGQPAGDALVYLESRGPGSRIPARQRAVIDQKNLAFTPRIVPVVPGTIIDFTNSDDIVHNVFSPSAAAGEFDLGTYGPGAVRSVTVSEPGEVLVLCNIHMEMEARVVVVRDPYFGLTRADGTYAIPEVPAGEYLARIWRDGFLPGARTVNVPASGEMTLDLEIDR
jgi:plastocyanin